MTVPPTIPKPVWSCKVIEQVLSLMPPPEHQSGVLAFQKVLLEASVGIALVVVGRWAIGRTPAGSADREVAPVLAAAFVGSVTSNFVGVAVWLWNRSDPRAWALGALIAAGCCAGFILSRTTGLPGFKEPEWEALGVLSLVVEAGFLGVALHRLRR